MNKQSWSKVLPDGDVICGGYVVSELYSWGVLSSDIVEFPQLALLLELLVKMSFLDFNLSEHHVVLALLGGV